MLCSAAPKQLLGVSVGLFHDLEDLLLLGVSVDHLHLLEDLLLLGVSAVHLHLNVLLLLPSLPPVPFLPPSPRHPLDLSLLHQEVKEILEEVLLVLLRSAELEKVVTLKQTYSQAVFYTNDNKPFLTNWFSSLISLMISTLSSGMASRLSP